jgi:magnesium transporter
MSNEVKLTVAFLDRAPQAAAQELQGLPLEEAAALLESLPARLSAPVLNEMIPWHGARILAAVSAARAAAVLRQLNFADSLGLARLMSSESRDRIGEELPTNYARRFRNALRYPQHQVGAWIDPDVPTLSVTDTIGDAVRVLRAAAAASHVFVESAEHALFVGTVAVREILRGEPSLPLEQLAINHVEAMSSTATLSSVIFDERWDELLYVPVVGRRGNLLGGVSRGVLRRAMHEQDTVLSSSRPSLVRELSGALLITCFGILKLTAESTGTVDRGAARAEQ